MNIKFNLYSPFSLKTMEVKVKTSNATANDIFMSADACLVNGRLSGGYRKIVPNSYIKTIAKLAQIEYEHMIDLYTPDDVYGDEFIYLQDWYYLYYKKVTPFKSEIVIYNVDKDEEMKENGYTRYIYQAPKEEVIQHILNYIKEK